jgi:hypothetical protein
MITMMASNLCAASFPLPPIAKTLQERKIISPAAQVFLTSAGLSPSINFAAPHTLLHNFLG